MDDRARHDEFARLATEQRNPRTMDLDTLDVPALLERISAEDRTVADAVARELPHVARAVDLVVASFREGGRLVYVGAGTSGRLGVLDAAECPPTFGSDPGRVVGVIAGGPEALLRAVLERRDCLRISAQLYFYILVRQVFRRAGILERDVADYVTEMLAEFAQAGRTRCRLPGPAQSTEYFFEMLAGLQTADEATRFSIRAHVGNYSLYLSGVFPERIRFRTERRAAPGLRYYEELGRINYRVAGEHRLAREYDLDGIFHTLAERFPETRRALNDLGDRLLNLGDSDATLDALLRSSLASAE